MFDNVNRVLLKKGLDDVRLPSCFIRLVVNMYFESSAILRVRILRVCILKLVQY